MSNIARASSTNVCRRASYIRVCATNTIYAHGLPWIHYGFESQLRSWQANICFSFSNFNFSLRHTRRRKVPNSKLRTNRPVGFFKWFTNGKLYVLWIAGHTYIVVQLMKVFRRKNVQQHRKSFGKLLAKILKDASKVSVHIYCK